MVMAYLAGANLIECNKRKRLGQHRRRQVLFCEDKGNQDAGE